MFDHYSYPTVNRRMKKMQLATVGIVLATVALGIALGAVLISLVSR